MLASGAADGSVGLWRVRTGLSETLDAHSASVRAAVFSPDGRTLYTASYDGSVIVWDLSGSRRARAAVSLRRQGPVRRVGGEPGRDALRSLARAESRHAVA